MGQRTVRLERVNCAWGSEESGSDSLGKREPR